MNLKRRIIRNQMLDNVNLKKALKKYREQTKTHISVEQFTGLLIRRAKNDSR